MSKTPDFTKEYESLSEVQQSMIVGGANSCAMPEQSASMNSDSQNTYFENPFRPKPIGDFTKK